MQYIEILIRLHKLRAFPTNDSPGTLVLINGKWQYRNNPAHWAQSFKTAASLSFPIFHKPSVEFREYVDTFVKTKIAKQCYQTRTLITIIKYLGGYDETTCSSSNRITG